jgi:hypothetical protein
MEIWVLNFGTQKCEKRRRCCCWGCTIFLWSCYKNLQTSLFLFFYIVFTLLVLLFRFVDFRFTFHKIETASSLILRYFKNQSQQLPAFFVLGCEISHLFDTKKAFDLPALIWGIFFCQNHQ